MSGKKTSRDKQVSLFTDLDRLLMLEALQREIHQMALEKGWYDGSTERNPAELIALMHSELSEALEAFRHNNPPDKHCRDFGNAEIEFADCIIRILDAGQHLGLNIGEALLAKIAFNATRPARHGGRKF